ncbi:MAG: hypothetical protein EPN23_06695 [Verrucomicrobia bacterium]|nr:MAG: hypothetical protein EPN23_06695 [Verrucomicrobiota bacterium]
MHTVFRMFFLLTVMALALTRLAHADAVRNGNELALNLTRWDKAKRTELAKARTGVLHTFRYLRIVDISPADPNTGGITLKTTEPSSTAIVIFTANTRLSLEIVKALTTNDAVAVNGRVVNISTNVPPRIRLDPAVVQFKDRNTPKLGREMLREVDRTAH